MNKKAMSYLGLGSLLLINILGFKIAVDKSIDLVDVVVAKEVIRPRTKISEDMIEVKQVPRVYLNENILQSKDDVIGKYTEIESIIPKGGFIDNTMIFDELDLPDFPSLKLKENQNVFSLPTDLVKSSGNSLTNNQRVDLHVTIPVKKENPISDILLRSVRIINVVDRKGNDMRESDSKVPSVINLAINEEYISLLKTASEIGSIDLYATAYPNEEECVMNEESLVLPLLNHE